MSKPSSDDDTDLVREGGVTYRDIVRDTERSVRIVTKCVVEKLHPFSSEKENVDSFDSVPLQVVTRVTGCWSSLVSVLARETVYGSNMGIGETID